ncbi:hypothetical protein BDV59DRAFT_91852 [Aspergillus ambiguus]|uniref:uncharacterized protein n=1 Tax=Aspergillus ambiguus TaxID=176160 RepID=UPI003CCCF51C
MKTGFRILKIMTTHKVRLETSSGNLIAREKTSITVKSGVESTLPPTFSLLIKLLTIARAFLHALSILLFFFLCTPSTKARPVINFCLAYDARCFGKVSDGTASRTTAERRQSSPCS